MAFKPEDVNYLNSPLLDELVKVRYRYNREPYGVNEMISEAQKEGLRLAEEYLRNHDQRFEKRLISDPNRST